jgi:hypothetical protein
MTTYATLIHDLAQFSKDTNEALWEYGRVYNAVRDSPDFNYADAIRAAKEQEGVDLLPPSTATKVATAYDAFCLRGMLPLPDMKRTSPYSAYEIARHTDITPENAPTYYHALITLTRKELLKQLREDNGEPEDEFATITITRAVLELMKEARSNFAEAVGLEDMSGTVFIEVMSTLALDSTHESLRHIWRRMHGEEEG